MKETENCYVLLYLCERGFPVNFDTESNAAIYNLHYFLFILSLISLIKHLPVKNY